MYKRLVAFLAIITVWCAMVMPAVADVDCKLEPGTKCEGSLFTGAAGDTTRVLIDTHEVKEVGVDVVLLDAGGNDAQLSLTSPGGTRVGFSLCSANYSLSHIDAIGDTSFLTNKSEKSTRVDYCVGACKDSELLGNLK